MLNYKISGTGQRQIIFVHGNSQSSGTWDDVVASQALKDYTLIMVDLPGHGESFRSNDPEKDYTLKGAGGWLADFINTFEANEYIVVTTSLGSNIFAEALPGIKNCKGAFLIGACIIGDGLMPADILQPNPAGMVSFMPDPTNDQVNAYVHEVIKDPDTTTKEKYVNVFLNTDKNFRQAIAECVAKGEWTDEVKNIQDINLPLALVYGENEKIINSSYLQNTSLKKWKNEIIMVKNAGHSVQLDQQEIVADMIKEFAQDCFK